jgi:hypothetical protein
MDGRVSTLAVVLRRTASGKATCYRGALAERRCASFAWSKVGCTDASEWMPNGVLLCYWVWWRMPCSLLGALVFTMVRYFMMVGGESIYTIAGVALRANVTLRVSVWDH